jgi:diguanylate cyclase (GGDEF)-like protein
MTMNDEAFSALPNLQADDDEIVRYATLLDSLGVGLMVFAADATLCLSNKVAGRLLGDAIHKWMNGNKAVSAAELPLLQVLRNSRPVFGRVMSLTAEGSNPVAVRVNALPVFAADDSVRRILVTLDDTGNQRAPSASEVLSIYDEVTGVFDQHYVMYLLENEIHRARRYGTPFTLAQVDIDLFLLFRDAHGDAVADSVLAEVGEVMGKCMREIDIVGRIGFDEFMLILPNVSLKHALVGLERLRAMIETATFGGGKFKLTISGGIIEYTGENPEALVERSRALVINARESGRNRFCLDVDIL